MSELPGRDGIVGMVVTSVQAVRPEVSGVDAGTRLLGAGAVLDSVGFITLLIALEGSLESQVDLSASFLEEGGTDREGSPFSTVGSLADHIATLLTQR